jgi:hypothetical protein
VHQSMHCTCFDYNHIAGYGAGERNFAKLHSSRLLHNCRESADVLTRIGNLFNAADHHRFRQHIRSHDLLHNRQFIPKYVVSIMHKSMHDTCFGYNYNASYGTREWYFAKQHSRRGLHDHRALA